MSEVVPDGWHIKLIDEFAKTSAGGTPSTQIKEYWENGHIPWMSSGEVHKKHVYSVDQCITQKGFDNSSAKLFPPKTLLVALAGQGKTRGTVAISEIELTTNQSVAAIMVKDENILPDFIYHNLDSRYEELRNVSGGSGRAGLNLAIIGEQEVRLPPLPEQQKIASILTSVDEVIEKNEAQISKLQDLKKGMMQELLTKGIGHTEFKDSPVGRIPKGWEIHKLLELSINGISNGVFRDPKNVGSGYRLINVTDMYQENSIDIQLVSLLRLEKGEFERNQVKEGDIFFTRSSLVLGGIAYCNINLSERNDITYDGHLMRVRPNNDLVLSKYLRYYCLSDYSRKYFMSVAKQSTMTTIGQQDIGPLCVALPQIAEQEEIVNIIDGVARKITLLKIKLDKLKFSKKALMQDLLTGKVRVNTGGM